MYELKNLRTGKKIIVHPIHIYLHFPYKELEELGYEHSELKE
jgi:hypothetical protein